MISLPTIPAWVENAACDPNEPELWQIKADKPAKAERDKVAQAKAVCAECPVRLLCLEDAIAKREAHGIWGGLTPAERHAMNAGQPDPIERAQHGDLAGYKRHITQGTRACEPCRAANAQYQRDRRREQAVRKVLAPPPRAVQRTAVTS